MRLTENDGETEWIFAKPILLGMLLVVAIFVGNLIEWLVGFAV